MSIDQARDTNGSFYILRPVKAILVYREGEHLKFIFLREYLAFRVSSSR